MGFYAANFTSSYTHLHLCLHINHAFFFLKDLRYDHTACNSRAWQKYGLKTRRKRIHHCMIEFLCRDVRRFSYTIVNVMIIVTVWNNRKFSVVYNRRIGMSGRRHIKREDENRRGRENIDTLTLYPRVAYVSRIYKSFRFTCNFIHTSCLVYTYIIIREIFRLDYI